jgi:hypothetical protein
MLWHSQIVPSQKIIVKIRLRPRGKALRMGNNGLQLRDAAATVGWLLKPEKILYYSTRTEDHRTCRYFGRALNPSRDMAEIVADQPNIRGFRAADA